MIDPLSAVLAVVTLVTAVKDIALIALKLQQKVSSLDYQPNTRTYSLQGAAESGKRSKVDHRYN